MLNQPNTTQKVFWNQHINHEETCKPKNLLLKIMTYKNWDAMSFIDSCKLNVLLNGHDVRIWQVGTSALAMPGSKVCQGKTGKALQT